MARPALNRWKQIGIQNGTKLFRKPPNMKVQEKSELKVKTQETMECILQNGKTRMSVNGLRDAENYFRAIDGNSVKNPQKAEGGKLGFNSRYMVGNRRRNPTRKYRKV